MYSASDLRKGLKLQIDGQPWVITDFEFKKPGKGQAIYNCKMKNMLTGSTLNRSYRSNEKFEKPELSMQTMQYSYNDGGKFIFMDQNYEQVEIGTDVLGNKQYFLEEDLDCEVLFFNGQPLDIELPNFIERVIVEVEPGAKGNTAAGNVTKPATLASGYTIAVPLFINQGETVRIDTRTGEYVDRVNKR